MDEIHPLSKVCRKWEAGAAVDMWIAPHFGFCAISTARLCFLHVVRFSSGAISEATKLHSAIVIIWIDFVFYDFVMN